MTYDETREFGFVILKIILTVLATDRVEGETYDVR